MLEFAELGQNQGEIEKKEVFTPLAEHLSEILPRVGALGDAVDDQVSKISIAR
ncbi:MAG: hypothetical protein KUG83_03065 [Gammaproteobacteria bacterium]|nr:hypothetical protein [Gammaproteobacteria bacterium]